MKATPAMAPPKTTGALTRAILWMTLALLSFSAIAIAGREASRSLSTTELILWRSVIGIVVLAAIYRIQDGSLAGARSTVMPVHVVRSVIHYSAQYAWLYALTLIPLAELFALEFTAPLWVALIAPLALGEKLTPWRMAAAGIGFLGAVLVAEPGLLTGSLQMSVSAGTLFAAYSALGFASSMMITKRLTRTDPAMRILFWMQVLQALIAVLVLAFAWLRKGQWPLAPFATTPASAWAWVVLLGIAGLGAHFGLTRAFGLADAIIVAPMDFLRLPLIAAVGAFVYHETLAPSVAIGAAVVVLGNFINVWAERRARTKPSA